MQDLLTWNESYSVGVPVLDQQHKGLIEIINRLERSGTDSEQVSQAFRDLDRYVNEHFRQEEAMMEAANYPDLAEHRMEHDAFRDWLQAVDRIYHNGGTSSAYIAESVTSFLKNWLVSHIMTTDKAYKPYIA